MPQDFATRRAQAAYGRASHTRQRAVMADVRRIELAIAHESDVCFGAIMSDYRDGSLSDATIRRRLESFSLAVRDTMETGFRLGSADWWESAVGLWGAAIDADPRLMGAIALSPVRALLESTGSGGKALPTLLEILKPPTKIEVLSIVNAPVNGMTWRERLSQMTSLRVSQTKMAKAIADAYAAGGNVRDVEAAIRPLVKASASAARTIARTESVRVANAMHERSMDQAGDAVVGYTRRATLDDVTRPEHARANGRVYRKDEPRPSMPDGPNCRCWFDPILSTDVRSFGGSLPPEARHVEAYAEWFDSQSPYRRAASVGREAFDAAAAKFGTTSPTWEQIGKATPDIEAQRLRGVLDTKAEAARAARRGAA